MMIARGLIGDVSHVSAITARVSSISARVKVFGTKWVCPSPAKLKSARTTDPNLQGRNCEKLLLAVDRIFGRFPKVFGIEFCKDVGGILACDANQFRAFARCRFDSLVFDWKSNDLSPFFWTEAQ